MSAEEVEAVLVLLEREFEPFQGKVIEHRDVPEVQASQIEVLDWDLAQRREIGDTRLGAVEEGEMGHVLKGREVPDGVAGT